MNIRIAKKVLTAAPGRHYRAQRRRAWAVALRRATRFYNRRHRPS